MGVTKKKRLHSGIRIALCARTTPRYLIQGTGEPTGVRTGIRIDDGPTVVGQRRPRPPSPPRTLIISDVISEDSRIITASDVTLVTGFGNNKIDRFAVYDR
ncbi:hypothetical protein EVAR_79360_1 [Eumeta japonica]|uniref:Uncharacterized protein n=1 Tax=Eumeta variegata TaxID=151549 RepID=A0A4C1THI1_EUMVA|nr:hypothetical protein EVAR_79360_1 [Eumeta japonica]